MQSFDILTLTIENLFTTSTYFKDKFDAFLYITKNLIHLNNFLASNLSHVKIFIVKQQLDFTDTKNTFFELVDEGFMSLPKKIKSLEIIEMIKRGLPKRKDSTHDIKINLR
jgi:hypothetical protein